MDLIFLSGTGHSWQAARWFQKSAGKQQSEPRPLEKTLPDRTAVGPESGPLGIFYPTYGFSPPWILLSWLWRLPPGCKRPVFLVNTRGAIRAGDRILWGISGTAFWLPWLVLLLKGFRVRAVTALDVPSNWVVAHPGPSMETAQMMLGRVKPEMARLFSRLEAGKTYFPARILLGLPVDFIFGLFGLAYLLIGRMALAKLFVASPACDLCGRCAADCPAGAIMMIPGPYWRRRCLSCMRCVNFCPRKAIYPAHISLLAGLAVSLPLFFFYGFSIINLLLAILLFTVAVIAVYPLVRYLASNYNIERKISLTTHWPPYKWWKNKP